MDRDLEYYYNRLKATFFKFLPKNTGNSSRWKCWQTFIDGKQCITCFNNYGKMYDMNESLEFPPPIHFNCRCRITPVPTLRAGQATVDKYSGADFHLYVYGSLPPNYISVGDAKRLGWERKKGNLWEVAPYQVIGGEVYYNREDKLPRKEGRVWYEADINYTGGFRSTDRMVYSNDGLIFVTYDHYSTFIEIV